MDGIAIIDVFHVRLPIVKIVHKTMRFARIVNGGMINLTKSACSVNNNTVPDVQAIFQIVLSVWRVLWFM